MKWNWNEWWGGKELGGVGVCLFRGALLDKENHRNLQSVYPEFG